MISETDLKAAAWDALYASARKNYEDTGLPVKLETGIRLRTAMEKQLRAIREMVQR